MCEHNSEACSFPFWELRRGPSWGLGVKLVAKAATLRG